MTNERKMLECVHQHLQVVHNSIKVTHGCISNEITANILYTVLADL